MIVVIVLIGCAVIAKLDVLVFLLLITHECCCVNLTSSLCVIDVSLL